VLLAGTLLGQELGYEVQNGLGWATSCDVVFQKGRISGFSNQPLSQNNGAKRYKIGKHQTEPLEGKVGGERGSFNK
jgi:hypothetical protein